MSEFNSISKALPIIVLYAYTSYRLMPALQNIYGSISQLRFVGPALDDLHKDLLSLKTSDQYSGMDVLQVKKSIILKHFFLFQTLSTSSCATGNGSFYIIVN